MRDGQQTSIARLTSESQGSTYSISEPAHLRPKLTLAPEIPLWTPACCRQMRQVPEPDSGTDKTITGDSRSLIGFEGVG